MSENGILSDSLVSTEYRFHHPGRGLSRWRQIPRKDFVEFRLEGPRFGSLYSFLPVTTRLVCGIHPGRAHMCHTTSCFLSLRIRALVSYLQNCNLYSQIHGFYNDVEISVYNDVEIRAWAWSPALKSPWLGCFPWGLISPLLLPVLRGVVRNELSWLINNLGVYIMVN